MTQDEFDTIIRKINAEYRTDGRWWACCPAHADSNPSLTLKLDGDKLLVKCWSNDCDAVSILKALTAELPKRKVEDNRKKTEHTYYNSDGSIYGRVLREYYFVDGVRKKKIYSNLYDPVLRTWAKGENGKMRGMSAKDSPLYGLMPLLASPANKAVFVVEGEGKVDLLLKHGIIAVCNQGGACKWGDHLSPWLLGRTVILVPDIDVAGYEHTSLVAKSLRECGVTNILFLDLGDVLTDKQDVVDFEEKFGIDEFKERARRAVKMPELQGQSPELRRLEKAAASDPKGRREGKASSQDYQNLFKQLVEIRKDIFSDDGMYWDETLKLWTPILNKVSSFRCAITDIMSKGSPLKFSESKVDDQLTHYISTLTPEFLIEVEEWDGEDRIQQIANHCEFDKTTRMTSEFFGYFLKDWYMKAIQRAFDPSVQNRMIVLQGEQGLGKDYMVDVLTKSLGQFSVPFQVTDGNNKDMYLQLSDAMILKIAEFDKTGRVHVSILKDIITGGNTKIRGSYERKAKIRPSRASFISTANIQDILRDSTGNRRYLLFFLKGINRDYPKNSPQILAQAWHYYKHSVEFGDTLKKGAEDCMERLIKALTPENPEDFIIEIYNQEVDRIIQSEEIERRILINRNGFLEQDQAQGIFETIKKRTGNTEKVIRMILKRRGYQKTIRLEGQSRRVWLMDPQEYIEEEIRPNQEGMILRKLERMDEIPF